MDLKFQPHSDEKVCSEKDGKNFTRILLELRHMWKTNEIKGSFNAVTHFLREIEEMTWEEPNAPINMILHGFIGRMTHDSSHSHSISGGAINLGSIVKDLFDGDEDKMKEHISKFVDDLFDKN